MVATKGGNALAKGTRTKFLIGETHKTKSDVSYTIIGYPNNPRRRLVQFSCGETRSVLTSAISSRTVQSKYDKTVWGVGYLGKYGHRADKHPLYYRWTNMLGRCYSKNHSGFTSYGAKGVYVSDELHDFSNYVKAVSSLKNYNRLIASPKQWDIDKDILSGTCYSPNTLKIIPKSANIEIENKSKRIPVQMIDACGNTISNFSSITEAEQLTGIHKGNIARSVRQGYMAGGYLWRAANA